jgi:hypothetical protein
MQINFLLNIKNKKKIKLNNIHYKLNVFKKNIKLTIKVK